MGQKTNEKNSLEFSSPKIHSCHTNWKKKKQRKKMKPFIHCIVSDPIRKYTPHAFQLTMKIFFSLPIYQTQNSQQKNNKDCLRNSIRQNVVELSSFFVCECVRNVFPIFFLVDCLFSIFLLLLLVLFSTLRRMEFILLYFTSILLCS